MPKVIAKAKLHVINVLDATLESILMYTYIKALFSDSDKKLAEFHAPLRSFACAGGVIK